MMPLTKRVIEGLVVWVGRKALHRVGQAVWEEMDLDQLTWVLCALAEEYPWVEHRLLTLAEKEAKEVYGSQQAEEKLYGTSGRIGQQQEGRY